MSIQEYFDGLKLIGDDYSKSQIKIWADEEKEAYANLGAQNKTHSLITFGHKKARFRRNKFFF